MSTGKLAIPLSLPTDEQTAAAASPSIPATVVAKLNATLNDILADGKVRERLVAVGVVIRGSTAQEFGTFMAVEFKRWNAVRAAAGIAQQ